MKIAYLLSTASLVAAAALVVVACGGTVVFEEEGGGGNGGAENGNGTGNASTGRQSSNAMAGTAGPGGVGGADSGPNLSKSSSGVGGEGCFYLEEGTTHCYSHKTCDGGPVQETECELGGGPRPCWCFLDGVFVGQCEEPDSWCGAQSQCCDALWP